MNCKQGDLAIVIAAVWDMSTIGRVVTCIQHVPKGFETKEQRAAGNDVWLVSDGREKWLHGDSRLRPIRDNDGEDETLQWAPVPKEETCSQNSTT